MKFQTEELRHKAVIALLQEHHEDMLCHSPPESIHALDLNALEEPDVTFWSVWIDQELAGIGAIKALDENHAEIKSMRTAKKHLRKGIAGKMLSHIIEYAKINSFKQLSLETGTKVAFLPAQKLYQQFGFEACEPFGNYKEDPFSMFMTKAICP